MSLLRKFILPQLAFRRNVGKCKYNWYDEGIKYHGFKYYPRKKDFVDPPYEPTKLFRVERIKPMKGLPYWEKSLLKDFKLDGLKNNCYTVVKNIPENNQKLWRIKHVLKIVPITYPDGFPKPTDHSYLKENGELRIVKQVTVLEEKLQLTEDFKKDVKLLDGDTLRRNSRLKWLNAWDTTC